MPGGGVVFGIRKWLLGPKFGVFVRFCGIGGTGDVRSRLMLPEARIVVSVLIGWWRI